MKRAPFLMVASLCLTSAGAASLRVVATLPSYADFAKAIGGEHVTVVAIVRGDQDAHFIRPKPSFVEMVRRAQVLLSTGLDLEMWLPTVINKSGNTHVRSGQPGFVSAAHGLRLLEKPTVLSRAEGGLHIYGNPHITSSPINMKTVARNIAYGLIKNDPEHKDVYLKNLKALQDRLDRRLFGAELVSLLGGDTLCSLAEQGKLLPFLQQRKYRGKPLITHLGGWMQKMMPLRGKAIVTYHKNWVYFLTLFGVTEAGTVEPKPGIPPSAKHVADLITLMRNRHIKIILAANYFDEHKVRSVASKVGAEAVIVPMYVGGAPETDDYFMLVDYWTDHLLAAARKAGIAA
ncbi:MAG: metal ABC transporter substrate-binding protein [Armatimonadota bacterium]